MVLRDSDAFDYAKAERIIPENNKVVVTFTVVPEQTDKGRLHIELQDAKGSAATRLIFDADGELKAKVGYRNSGIMKYEAGKAYEIRLELDQSKRIFNVFVNGQSKGAKVYFAPVASFKRVVFRTGEVRRFPDADTPTDQNYDLPNSSAVEAEAVFVIKSLKTANN